MFTLDTSTAFGARVANRLERETVIWLTTAGASGTPQPVPVWFLWDGSEFLIFSQPDRPKLRNIGHNPRVSLNFDSDGRDDIVVFTGDARIDESGPSQQERADYVAKYRDEIRRIGFTPEELAQEYSVTVRVAPGRVRGH